VDSRAVPSPVAWQLGWKSATLLIERHFQDHGDWPKRIALSAWGTANMRTGGDDIAQALALMGVKPAWDNQTNRVTGFEIIPSSVLGRPRVDVVFRVSGFFRDAFPFQIDLIDSAARAVSGLDEDAAINPLAAQVARDSAAMRAAGIGETDAQRRAGYRVFGSKPGAYGAGLQALIDERCWETDEHLADAYLAWGGYAYGDGSEGQPAHDLFAARLKTTATITTSLKAVWPPPSAICRAASRRSITTITAAPRPLKSGRWMTKLPVSSGPAPPIQNGSSRSCGMVTRAPSRSRQQLTICLPLPPRRGW
jgi:cobaltochelatase CobN